MMLYGILAVLSLSFAQQVGRRTKCESTYFFFGRPLKRMRSGRTRWKVARSLRLGAACGWWAPEIDFSKETFVSKPTRFCSSALFRLTRFSFRPAGQRPSLWVGPSTEISVSETTFDPANSNRPSLEPVLVSISISIPITRQKD